MRPDTSEMIPAASLEDEELIELARQASDFLSAFPWCAAVQEILLAFEIGAPLAIFLVRIEPHQTGVADTLWVVVGDVPPAWLVCDQAPDWATALKSYISEMRRWVTAVRTSGRFEGIVPVDAAPTRENAELLAARLDFIQRHILDGEPVPEEEEEGEVEEDL